MKAYIIASTLGLALFLPTITYADSAPPPPSQNAPAAAQEVAKPRTSQAIGPAVSNAFVIGCYTCGGRYPYHVGTASLGGVNNRVWEWGAGCSGVQTWRSDNIPYMCANHP